MEVTCLVYDLSHGMARRFSSVIVGVSLDIIPHTSIQVFDREFFFGGGIQELPVGEFAASYNAPLVEKIVLGRTSRTKAEFIAWLSTVRSLFSPETYDVFKNNCNNFSDCCAKFLLGENGNTVPARILDLPSVLAETDVGKIFASEYERLQADISGKASNELMPNSSALLNVKVKVSREPKIVECPVVSFDSTVQELMKSIEKKTGYAAADQRLICHGKRLSDLQSPLSACGVDQDTVVHLVPKPNAQPYDTTSPKTSEGSSALADFDAALVRVAKAPKRDQKIAIEALRRILENIVIHPLEERYRNIKRNNPAFTKRLNHVDGALDCLRAIGFVEQDTNAGDRLLTLQTSEEAWKNILQFHARLKEESKKLEQQFRNQPTPLSSNMSGPGSFGNMFNAFSEGRGELDFSDMLGRLASNPAFLQQSMEMLRQMRNPNENRTGDRGASADGSTANTGSNDSEMTEEEMLQEAIRRSLREQ